MTDTDRLLIVIRELQGRHPEKRAPTMQEIGKRLGITRQAVYKRIKVAERRGLLEIIPRKHRGIILL